jgi:SET domain-containing protein
MSNKPAILPIGAMMNHSCTPNIKFYEQDNCMYFETLCNISKNTELCYSYLRNTNLVNTRDKLEY